MVKVINIKTPPNKYYKAIANKKISQGETGIKLANSGNAFSIWHASHSSYSHPAILPEKISCPRTTRKVNNFHALPNNSARGEVLSSKRNRFFLKELKKLKIDTIIDLREKYSSSSFPELCAEHNLNYFNIPIDSHNIPDKKILDKLPEFFKIMNKGGYYIACAQGLHRTDIAMSIDYVFNPREKAVPILYGHYRNNEFKFEDIARRLHSLRKNMSKQYLKKLGWDEEFYEEFQKRKAALKDYNKFYFETLKK